MEWTYKQFDTVAYSIQHNIIQLIKAVVDMSTEIGALANQASNNDAVIGDLVEINGNIVQALNDISTILSQISGTLAIHEERIYQLEQKVGI